MKAIAVLMLELFLDHMKVYTEEFYRVLFHACRMTSVLELQVKPVPISLQPVSWLLTIMNIFSVLCETIPLVLSPLVSAAISVRRLVQRMLWLVV